MTARLLVQPLRPIRNLKRVYKNAKKEWRLKSFINEGIETLNIIKPQYGVNILHADEDRNLVSKTLGHYSENPDINSS